MSTESPDLAALDELWRRANEERDYWAVHRAAYTHEYPEEFVAVLDGKVAAHDPDLRALIQQLDAIGLQLSDVWLEYMVTARRPFLL